MTTRDVSKTKIATTPQERVVVSFLDAFNSHDLNAMDRLLANNYVFEGTGAPLGTSLDRQRVHELNKTFLDAFPDIHFDIQQIISQGDTLCLRWTATATHTGALRTPTGSSIQPTNRRVRGAGCTISEVKGDKIVKDYVYWDMSNLLMQLGALPPV